MISQKHIPNLNIYIKGIMLVQPNNAFKIAMKFPLSESFVENWHLSLNLMSVVYLKGGNHDKIIDRQNTNTASTLLAESHPLHH